MKYTRSLLKGHDKESQKMIAKALHIPMPKAKLKRKGVRHK